MWLIKGFELVSVEKDDDRALERRRITISTGLKPSRSLPLVGSEYSLSSAFRSRIVSSSWISNRSISELSSSIVVNKSLCSS